MTYEDGDTIGINFLERVPNDDPSIEDCLVDKFGYCWDHDHQVR